MEVKQTHKFLARWQSNGMSAFGQAENFDDAVKALTRELREISVLKKEAVVSFMIYSVGIDNYLQWDDSNVEEYDANDVKIGIAMPDHWITECNIKKPLTTLRINDWRIGYFSPEHIEGLLTKRTDYKAA